MAPPPALINAVGKEVDKICLKDNLPCLEFVGTLEHGCIIIAVATLFMWAAMVLARLVNDAVATETKSSIKPAN